MARLIIAAAVALAFFGGQGLPAQQPASSSDETARINAWFEKKYEEQLAFSPIQQTFLGRKSAAIDDMSIAAQDKQLAWQRASVAEMKQAFDYAKLTPEAQTSYDLWIYQLQQAEAALPFRSNAYVFDQMSAIHAFFPQLLIAFHRVDDTADLEAYVARIRESGRALRQLIEISKRNVVAGVRPPRFSFDFVIDESTKIITGAPFDKSGTDSAVWADVKAKVAELQKKGTLSEAKASALLDEARAALTGPFRAAYQDLIAWQKEDRRNAPEKTSGVGALPNGAAYYRERLANQTTTTLSADEIHQIGLTEVARLRGEMEAIRKEVGFSGDLRAFFAELRDKKDDRRLLLSRHRRRTCRLHQGCDGGHRPDQGGPAKVLRHPSQGRSRRQAGRAVPRAAGRRAALLPKHAGRLTPWRLLRAPGGHEGDAQVRARGHRVSRRPARPPHADRDRAGADDHPDLPASGDLHARTSRVGRSTRSGWPARCPAPTRIRIRVSAGSARRSGERFGWSSTRASTRRAGRRKRPCSTSSPTRRRPSRRRAPRCGATW